MHKWQDAHVGRESPQMAVRMTEEEKERLEQMRQELRLTSKGQVIRWALDIAERMALVASAFDRDPHKTADEVLRGVEHHHAENIRRNMLAERAGVSGSPGDTAAGEEA